MNGDGGGKRRSRRR
ncbi:hypothetical protein A2U01_0066175, partial [Trifolium medium]|nr:hypothetical protein [Trifolium medium]